MISDLELAQACNDTYDIGVTWWRLNYVDEVWVGIRLLAGGSVVVLRGSEVATDWVRDMRGLPTRHPVLGLCHRGFLAGMDDAGAWVAATLPKGPYAVTGHSLGAARALIVAGLLTAAGRPPDRLVTFGTPRPGFRQLAGILTGGGFPIVCYKNRNDPVTGVPWLRFPGGDGFCLPVTETSIDVPGEDEPGIDIVFRDHHMPLYMAGVARIASEAAKG